MLMGGGVAPALGGGSRLKDEKVKREPEGDVPVRDGEVTDGSREGE